MSKCRHVERSQEAYCSNGEGEFVEAEVLLCTWADAHPGRFVNAPRWLSKDALAGRLIHPQRDCTGCPGFAVESPTTNQNSRSEG